MARLDLDGSITDANPAFTILLGFSSEQVAGRRFLDLLHPDESRLASRGWSTRYQAGAVRGELRFASSEGKAVWIRLAITRASESEGGPDFLLATLENITEAKAQEAQMEYHVLHDLATGLPNTPLLMDRLSHAIRSAERRQGKVGVIVIDVTNLEGAGASNVNSHVATIASQLEQAVRSSDTIGRTDEHELTVIVTEIADDAALEGIVVKLLAAADPRFRMAGPPPSMAGIIGTAHYPAQGNDAHELVRTAQVSLYLGAHALPQAAIQREEAEAGDHEAENRYRTLETVALFSSISDQVLRRLARYMNVQTAIAGEELDGPESQAGLYIVESGACEVVTGGPENSPVLTLGPSDFVAPGAIAGDLQVRLRAATDVRLLVLGKEGVREHAPAGSPLHRALHEAAGQRERQLRGLMARTHPAPGAGGATKIALYSTKGGAGRTTMALNLAGELAAKHRDEVLVIDLAMPFNHVALLANLQPSTCLARLGAFSSGNLPFGWSALLPHRAGFMVLPAALRPEEAELVNAQLLNRVIDALSSQFKYIIFDLGTALDETVLTALELSDHVVLLALPELAAMHDTRRMLDLVTRVLQIPSSRVHVTLTHRSPNSTMSRADVEKIMERRLAAEIAYHGTRSELVGLEGQLLVQVEPKGPYARSLADLSKSLRAAQLVPSQTA